MNTKIIKTNRKTMSISVKAGQVIVQVPKQATDEQIQKFIYRHRKWIENRVAEQTSIILTLRDGECIPILGCKVVLQTGNPRLSGNVLYLPRENREEALVSFLKRTAAERMIPITETVAKRYGFSYAHVNITSARTRWGSCSTRGVISYTFRSAFLPDDLALYLVVHELCHTRQMNHSEKFWALVEGILPNYKKTKELLNQYTWALSFP